MNNIYHRIKGNTKLYKLKNYKPIYKYEHLYDLNTYIILNTYTNTYISS